PQASAATRPRSSSARRPPPRRSRLLLRAEPPLAACAVDARRLPRMRTGHVIDAVAAPVDVALDQAVVAGGLPRPGDRSRRCGPGDPRGYGAAAPAGATVGNGRPAGFHGKPGDAWPAVS